MLDGNPSKAMDLCVPYAGGGCAKSESMLSVHRESGSGGASSASSTSFESLLSKSSQPKRNKKRSANALVDLTHSDDEDEEAPVASAYRGGGGSIATGGGLLGLSAASEPSKSSVFKYRLVPPIDTGERERIKDIALLNALMVPTLDNKAMLTIKTTIDAIAEKYPKRVIKIGSSFVREVTTRTSSAQYPTDDYDRSLAVVISVLFSNDSAGANAEGYGIAYAKERGICVNVRQEKEGSFGRNEKRGAAGDAGWSEGDPGCIYIAMTRYCTSKDFHDNYRSYHYLRANYTSGDLDDNGRKIHVNSVTGEAGAKAYKDGRKEHVNSVTGEAGAKAYKDGRKEHVNSVTGEAGAKAYKDGRKEHVNSVTGEAGAKAYKDGRKEHVNSVTGEAGAKAYKDGRKEHVNSVTGEAGAKAYKDGRKPSSRHYDKETIASMSLSTSATLMPSHRARSESGRVILKTWTKQEDDALLDGVKRRGEGNWAQIRADNLAVLKDRNTTEILHRFDKISGKRAAKWKAKTASLQRKTTAAGSLKRKRWTDDEVNAVWEGVRKFGTQWTEIKKAFPGRLKDRTPINIGDKYRQLSGLK